jgi:NifB/MoaA-like Fe-S oxidoreductase
MSKIHLNAIATRALLDGDFKKAVLNGKRREKLDEFSLSENEIQAVMEIEANSLDQFIRGLGTLMHNQSSSYPVVYERH